MNERVLLLNGNYTALTSITIPKAVKLLLADEEKVRPVGEPLCFLRTPSAVFPVPAIMALTRYINVPDKDKKWSRHGLFERDNYTCIFCNARQGEKKLDGSGLWVRADFTIEHIKPTSRGGGTTWGNTAVACYSCNHRKADRMPHEAGMKLLWEPKTPRVGMWVASGKYPKSWEQYLPKNRT